MTVTLGEVVVDLFAGGGGASTGIEAALGRPCDIAINHDPIAISMHRANHPNTRHFCESIWKVDPRVATGGRAVGLAWFSPDCVDFSRAKGSKPVRKEIRSLAWVVLRWAKTVKPRIIVLENVEEFEGWGPLLPDGRRDPKRVGQTFRLWLGKLRAQGYSIDFRSLVAADYGAPTIRRRLFLIARRDSQPIVWPLATHGKGTARDWRPAFEVIDWSLPCPSIFERKRPLAEATLRRIVMGIQRYVIDCAEPFIVRHGHYSKRTGAGLRPGCGAGIFRGQSLNQPLATICQTNDKSLVVPVLNKHYGGMVGHEVTKPLGAITARDSHGLSAALLQPRDGHHVRTGQVRAFLTKYYGGGPNGKSGIAQDLREPLHTIRAKACFGLVEVHGEAYQITDIGMRMLEPHELFAAQGFPEETKLLGIDEHGREITLTKTQKTSLVGNSVSPPVARAIVAEVRRDVGRAA